MPSHAPCNHLHGGRGGGEEGGGEGEGVREEGGGREAMEFRLVTNSMDNDRRPFANPM